MGNGNRKRLFTRPSKRQTKLEHRFVSVGRRCDEDCQPRRDFYAKWRVEWCQLAHCMPQPGLRETGSFGGSTELTTSLAMTSVCVQVGLLKISPKTIYESLPQADLCVSDIVCVCVFVSRYV
ncbi:unnamed protein product [Protopolystoma xenopodis]|uniref:Uncharacterized protein n=1 Tax=Protopolystoma xenopodis TaxID=117903 RepID=A0A448XHJ7_9PLAT|nr:unnamed protein product [Protopolystoma xenopodis]